MMRSLPSDDDLFAHRDIEEAYPLPKSILGRGSYGFVFGTRCPYDSERVAFKVQVLRPGWRENKPWRLRTEAGVAMIAGTSVEGISGARRSFVDAGFCEKIRRESGLARKKQSTWRVRELTFWQSVKNTLSKSCKSFDDVFVIEMPFADESLYGKLKAWGCDPKKGQVGITHQGAVAKWFRQVAAGLQYLHDKNFMHRDIKPQNILLYEDVYGGTDARLCDFGLVKYMSPADGRHTKGACTLHYMSPEMLLAMDYSIPHDIWSMGTLFVELMYGDLTWTGRTPHEMICEICSIYRLLDDSAPAVTFHDDGVLPHVSVDLVKREDLKQICKGECTRRYCFNGRPVFIDGFDGKNPDARQRAADDIIQGALDPDPRRRCNARELCVRAGVFNDLTTPPGTRLSGFVVADAEAGGGHSPAAVAGGKSGGGSGLGSRDAKVEADVGQDDPNAQGDVDNVGDGCAKEVPATDPTENIIPLPWVRTLSRTKDYRQVCRKGTAAQRRAWQDEKVCRCNGGCANVAHRNRRMAVCTSPGEVRCVHDARVAGVAGRGFHFYVCKGCICPLCGVAPQYAPANGVCYKCSKTRCIKPATVSVLDLLGARTGEKKTPASPDAEVSSASGKRSHDSPDRRRGLQAVGGAKTFSRGKRAVAQVKKRPAAATRPTRRRMSPDTVLRRPAATKDSAARIGELDPEIRQKKKERRRISEVGSAVGRSEEWV